jgi:hypothetical protein
MGALMSLLWSEEMHVLAGNKWFQRSQPWKLFIFSAKSLVTSQPMGLPHVSNGKGPRNCGYELSLTFFYNDQVGSSFFLS